VELLPAIDVHEGGAVRLVQGDFGRVRRYGDPVELARSYAAAGARWVHVVDLDAARRGEAVNRAVVLAIVEQVEARVQVSGGVRTQADAEALLHAGADRVVVGTAVLETPELVASLALRFPGRVAVGLDHRGARRELAVRGWEHPSAMTLAEVLERLDDVALGAGVVTAIDRDGTLQGPDLAGLGATLELTGHPVVASGGVRDAADLETLRRLQVGGRRLAGAIVGTALAEGVMTVEEGIAACAPSG